MKAKHNSAIIFGAILALQVCFTQQSFADHSKDENFEKRVMEYDHKAYLASEAYKTEIKTMGYDRDAYRTSLENVNHWDLKEMQLGLRAKASVACTGTVLLTGLTGIMETIPIINFFIVKAPAMDTVDHDTVSEMVRTAQRCDGGCGSGANPVIATSILLGAGIASIGGPSKAYLGTRIAHEGFTRVMGCRQSLLKLEDIEHALNLLRAD